ncbi:hypothetical protein B0T25DRAFT_570426 [Lasiosphaeria hispida]|uniref:Uncharacterized protein n=1 Tax=Lasiosphaeria hispida TaxID=260671 RepID=A0AAJ0HFD6_9PEZI|nr:hypothetical protein B0T25DRAFT_570426 [Lasiosphaeria hispida]
MLAIPHSLENDGQCPLLGRHRGIGVGVDDILAVLAFFFSGFTIYFNVAGKTLRHPL